MMRGSELLYKQLPFFGHSRGTNAFCLDNVLSQRGATYEEREVQGRETRREKKEKEREQRREGKEAKILHEGTRRWRER